MDPFTAAGCSGAWLEAERETGHIDRFFAKLREGALLMVYITPPRDQARLLVYIRSIIEHSNEVLGLTPWVFPVSQPERHSVQECLELVVAGKLAMLAHARIARKRHRELRFAV
jgi:hypothetical protein